jgi:hypothetical protein
VNGLAAVSVISQRSIVRANGVYQIR